MGGKFFQQSVENNRAVYFVGTANRFWSKIGEGSLAEVGG